MDFPWRKVEFFFFLWENFGMFQNFHFMKENQLISSGIRIIFLWSSDVTLCLLKTTDRKQREEQMWCSQTWLTPTAGLVGLQAFQQKKAQPLRQNEPWPTKLMFGVEHQTQTLRIHSVFDLEAQKVEIWHRRRRPCQRDLRGLQGAAWYRAWQSDVVLRNGGSWD